MKSFVFSFLVILLVTVPGCCKSKSATIVRDCTGTYLRISEKDYRVCNFEKVANYLNGEEVVVTFNKTCSCTGPANDQIQCMMYHEFESWIEVTKIK